MFKLVASIILAVQIFGCYASPMLPRVTDIPLQPNFTLSKYTGHWFEIYRTKNMPFEWGTDDTANYAANADGTVGVTNKEWRPELNKCSVATAVATVPDPKEPARLAVKFYPWAPAGDYRVLETDYTGYSVVYSEDSSFGTPVQFGWILARTKTISDSTVNHAFDLFEQRAKLDRSAFEKTEHGVAPVGSGCDN